MSSALASHAEAAAAPADASPRVYWGVDCGSAEIKVAAVDAAGNDSPPSVPALVVAHDEAFTTYAAWRSHYFTATDLANEGLLSVTCCTVQSVTQ